VVGRSRPASGLGSRSPPIGRNRQLRQYNRSNLRTVTVATVTTNEQLAALPGNVAIPADVAGLEADSVLNVTQIATVDRGALEERIGTVPDWLMAQIDTGLARALALAHL